LKDLVVDGVDNIKMDFRDGLEAGCYEHGDELLFSQRNMEGEFLD
jgi:hypothetical protein